MDTSEQRRQLDLVIGRLTMKFPQLPQDIIAAAVRDAEAGLCAARIRDFVPILVEKQARDWLAAQLRPSKNPTPALG